MLKRGISGVVSVVLIILLVLGASTLIWAFLRPLILGVGEDANVADCLLVDVAPRDCLKEGNMTEIVNVTIRNAGEEYLTGLKFVFNRGEKIIDLSDSLVLTNNGVLPDALEIKTYKINTTLTTNVDDFNVAGVVGSDNICEPAYQRVRCRNF